MTSGTIAHAGRPTVLGLVALIAGCQAGGNGQDAGEADASPAAEAVAATPEALLYGRITARDGTLYEGRLRWGGDQEALWGSYFNGWKGENPWVGYAPSARRSLEVLGIQIAAWEGRMDGDRPFMARLGDITRIEPSGGDLRVTLKSGAVFVLDRNASDDLGDGLRVWDPTLGVVDLNERQIDAVEFLPAPGPHSTPYPLYGTAHTREGDFTGLVEWNRDGFVGSDQLGGMSADGYLSLRFDTIRAIERRDIDSSVLTLLDGHEIVLSGTPQVGRRNRGLYVDDPRYGRVLVSWEAFERVDLSPGRSAPGYADFPPGGPLSGAVTTRSGRRLAGRLVYDLDESETTETLDAPRAGVTYNIPFGLVSEITLPGPGASTGRATVLLHSGEELQLELSGDLSEENGGMLVFVEGAQQPEYVPWPDVGRVELDAPTLTYPPSEPG